MDRIRSIFRSPVTLIGTGFATFALALFVAGLVTGGFSLAQESTPTVTAGATEASPEATPSDTTKDTLRDDFLNNLADNLGVGRDQLDAALKQTGLDMVDQALADGKITEDEAARIRERIESGDGFFFGPGFGHHGRGEAFRHGFKLGANLDDIANFLSVDVQDVTSALRDGQSLTQIAEDHGKSRDELKSFLVSKAQERLDEAVTNGDLTQDEADSKLADATTRIDEMIDREGLPGPMWGPGMMPHDRGPDGESDTGGTMFDPGNF